MQINKKFKALLVILDFDECATKYVRLWSYSCLQENQFLNLDRTPLSTPSISDSEFGHDTVF